MSNRGQVQFIGFDCLNLTHCRHSFGQEKVSNPFLAEKMERFFRNHYVLLIRYHL